MVLKFSVLAFVVIVLFWLSARFLSKQGALQDKDDDFIPDVIEDKVEEVKEEVKKKVARTKKKVKEVKDVINKK